MIPLIWEWKTKERKIKLIKKNKDFFFYPIWRNLWFCISHQMLLWYPPKCTDMRPGGNTRITECTPLNGYILEPVLWNCTVISRHVRVQNLIWFQTFLLFTKTPFWDFECIEKHIFSGISDNFRLFQTFSHSGSHTPEFPNFPCCRFTTCCSWSATPAAPLPSGTGARTRTRRPSSLASSR